MKTKLKIWAWLKEIGITIQPIRQVMRYSAKGEPRYTMSRYMVKADISEEDQTLRVIQITDTFSGALQAGFAHLIHKI